MDFYKNWLQCRQAKEDETYYFKAFLEKKDVSIELFEGGQEAEIAKAVKFLMSISIDEFLKHMNYEELIITPDQIIQYSNYKHGAINLCKYLGFCDSLSFVEIGEKLIHAKLPGANKKYGENHSKLACELSFVKLKREKFTKVYITKLGEITIPMNESDIMNLSCRLILRNDFIKKIISTILKSNELVEYSFFTNGVLSKSTSIRRKSNIKNIINFILNNCSNSSIKNRIIW